MPDAILNLCPPVHTQIEARETEATELLRHTNNLPAQVVSLEKKGGAERVKKRAPKRNGAQNKMRA